MPDPIRSDEPHDEAEELLPWYATGQLDAADRAKVERHLSACASCQRQLGVERQLIEEFQSLTPEVDTSWARLRARIEPPAASRSRFSAMAYDIWALLRRPAVATLAAAQLAFLLIGGTVLLTMSRPDYRTLGGPEASAKANLLVIFRPDATEEDIRDALRSSGASLVGGPTSTDAYLLNVPARQRQAALARLQADEDVEMAQPIDASE